MNKQLDVIVQIKQNLIEAFWSFYCEKRIEKVTVKEITQKPGYNRGTFYKYSIGVYDVLEQIEQSLIHALNFVLLGDNGDPAFASKLKNLTKTTLKQALSENYALDPTELYFILEYALSAMIGIMSYWFRQDKVLPNDLKCYVYAEYFGIKGMCEAYYISNNTDNNGIVETLNVRVRNLIEF